jgi:acetyltransferase-like isoleucine patch superfamily enzyme
VELKEITWGYIMIHEIGENTLIHHSVTSYGRNSVGAYSLILDNVVLGFPTVEHLVELRDHHRFVYEFDFLGVTLREHTILRSDCTLYRNIEAGHHFRTGHRVLIRENTSIGHNVIVGSYSVLDADVKLGNNVSIQSHVCLSKGCVCEDDVFLGPNCVALNDKYPVRKGTLQPVRICSGASVGGNVTILPGVVIGEGAMVGAGSVVTRDVPAWHLAVGNPARFSKLDDSLIARNRLDESLLEKDAGAQDPADKFDDVTVASFPASLFDLNRRS